MPLLRRLTCAIILLATAGAGLPVPRLVFDTPLPAATAGQPATRLPYGAVTHKVQQGIVRAAA